MDAVHVHKPTALEGSVCTAAEPSMWPEGTQAVEGDQVIHILPKRLVPQAEVRA